MQDLTKIIGVARLGQDPELKTLNSGTTVCKLRVVWNNQRKIDGEYTDVPCWMDMDVWGAQGEAVARYMSQGSQIFFEGRLEQRSWENEQGEKRYAYQITAERVQFASGGKNGGSGDSSSAAPAPASSPPPAAAPPASAGPPPGGDEIPFSYSWA